MGDALIKATRETIPVVANHALFATGDEQRDTQRQKTLEVAHQLQLDWVKATGEEVSNLHYAFIVQASAWASGVGACREFSCSVYVDALLCFPPEYTIEKEYDLDIDHGWVKVSAPGLDPIILDAWVPLSNAVLARHYSYYSSFKTHFYRPPSTEFGSPGLATGEPITAYVRLRDALRKRATALYQSLPDRPTEGDRLEVRLTSSVTGTGHPIVYSPWP